jgi:hypothetical protein
VFVSISIIFVHTLQTTLNQSNTTQDYFNSFDYLDMYATCFCLYLGHLQTWQYKNLTNEDTRKISGTPFLQSRLKMLKHKIDAYYIFLCKVFCIDLPEVQAETCSVHVRVTSWIKINLCCVKLRSVVCLVINNGMASLKISSYCMFCITYFYLAEPSLGRTREEGRNIET